jgi:hypothetical protein
MTSRERILLQYNFDHHESQKECRTPSLRWENPTPNSYSYGAAESRYKPSIFVIKKTEIRY